MLGGHHVGQSVGAQRVREQPVPSWGSPVSMPVHTVGECRGLRTCGQYRTDLADGWCVAHWDSGPPGASRPGRYRSKATPDLDSADDIM